MIDKIFENSAIGTCFGFIFVTVILFILLNNVFFWLKSFRWLETKGKIIKSERIDTELDEEVIVKVVYQYNIHGRTYISDRVHYLEAYGPAAPSWFYKYKVGMDVPVFFNPNKPSQSILIKKVSPINIIMYLFCIAALCWMLYKMICICNWMSAIETLKEL